MEWNGTRRNLCVVRFFSMMGGGDFDSMRRDARPSSVGPSVRRSVDRWIVRVASSAHRKPSAVGKSSRDATPRTDGSIDRSGPIERARIGTRAFDRKRVMRKSSRKRTNGTVERTNERTTQFIHRDVLATPLRHPSVVRRPFRISNTPHHTHPSSVVGSRPEETTEGRAGTNERFRNGTRRSMLFFGRDLVCDFDESRFVKSVPPILGISSRIWLI